MGCLGIWWMWCGGSVQMNFTVADTYEEVLRVVSAGAGLAQGTGQILDHRKHDLSRSALAAATQRVAWDQILIVYPAALSSLIIENPIASIDSGMALYTNPSMFEGRATSPFTRQHTLRLPRRARNSFLRSTSANVSWSALYATSSGVRSINANPTSACCSNFSINVRPWSGCLCKTTGSMPRLVRNTSSSVFVAWSWPCTTRCDWKAHSMKKWTSVALTRRTRHPARS